MKNARNISQIIELPVLKYVILLLLCFLCYYDTLKGDFVFDDLVAVVKNKDVTDPTTSLKEIFRHDFWGYNLTDPHSHKSYRPLAILMFNYEYQYFELKSYGMKFVNFLLHSLNTCLLFKFYSGLTSRISTFFVASILFAVHPVHVEAVCGVVGRAELMFCLCYLLSLCLFSRINFGHESNFGTLPTFMAIAALSVVGLLFKENAIMILPACVAYDVTVRTNLFQHIENRFRVKRVVFSRCGILISLSIFLLSLRLYLQNFESPKFKPMDNPVAASEDVVTKILSQNYLYVLNAWIMLCPEWLSFDWALGCIRLVESLMDYRVFAIIAFNLFLYILIFRCSRLILLSIALIVVPFLPASGIIKVGFVIAERILYVPSIGFCLLVAIGFSVLIERYYKFKFILFILLFVLIVVFILRTRERANQWTTEEKLFSSALHICPDNAKVHYNIAKLAADKKEFKVAFKHYHEAIRVYPDYESALMNLGNLYREIGDLQTAEKYLKASIDVLEDFPAAWMNLGIVQSSQHRFEEAEKSYHKALSLKRKYPTCLYNLGNLYLDMKNYSMAIKHWQESVAINGKQSKAWANILALLDNRGLLEDALRISERALIHVPADTSILFIRANILGKLKKFIEAEQLYKKVIEANSTNALYHANLGVLYHRWGKYNLAVESYRNAIRLDDNMKSAKDNLSKLLTKIKNK